MLNRINTNLFASLVTLTACVCATAPLAVAQDAVNGTPSIIGTILDSAGRPLVGAAVSAQASDRMFSTSVYTDERGRYVFPHLTAEHYQLWAQDMGHVTARSQVSVQAPCRDQRSEARAAERTTRSS